MEIRRIGWRRGIEQVADCKLKSGFIFEESDLLLALIGAMQAEEGLEEVASCIHVGYLKIDVFESQGLPRSGARLGMAAVWMTVLSRFFVTVAPRRIRVTRLNSGIYRLRQHRQRKRDWADRGNIKQMDGALVQPAFRVVWQFPEGFAAGMGLCDT
jgi:hypothetical protein